MAWGDPWGAPWGSIVPNPHTPGTVPGAAESSDDDPPVLDVASLLRARIVTVLRRSPNYLALVNWIGERFQALETAARAARDRMALTNAYGVQLDKHGYGLGLPRNGLNDDHYRQALIVRWGALFRRRTAALTTEILTVLASGTGTTFTRGRTPPAAYFVILFDITAAEALRWVSLLRTAKPEGVRFQAHVQESSADAFSFDGSGRGFDDPASQYAYTLE